ncbi:RDD family protein [uncultured Sulfitobacter sp.]|uniref:RDD family protein n=1 Tax=uncultured Sulfitobacter sp. TaxID=191468 RepID=UPI002605A335|nr:RDD family protein [uncultured Sulfitobacter sp.]
MTPDPELQPQFYDGVPTKRLLAWGVDTLVTVVLTLVVIPFTAFIGLFFLPLLYLLLGFAYRTVTLSRSSATWGMQLMAIELRTRDDNRFDLPTAFLHTAGYTVSLAMPLLQLISIVLMLSTERRQGLSDHVLGTVALNRRA